MPKKRPTGKTGSRKTATLRKSTLGAAKKLNLYEKHKNEYVASATKPSIVRVGPAHYLAAQGRSAPASEEFNRAIAALYNVAFTIKMARKAAGQDYSVTKLEGLWWSADGPVDSENPPAVWDWELIIRVPTFVNQKDLDGAIAQLVEKGKGDDVRKVRLASLTEGECVQMLHIGPYTEEKPTIAKMRAFAEFAGRSFSGKHHEIYLSDPRRTSAEKLKTILRQPIS